LVGLEPPPGVPVPALELSVEPLPELLPPPPPHPTSKVVIAQTRSERIIFFFIVHVLSVKESSARLDLHGPCQLGLNLKYSANMGG